MHAYKHGVSLIFFFFDKNTSSRALPARTRRLTSARNSRNAVTRYQVFRNQVRGQLFVDIVITRLFGYVCAGRGPRRTNVFWNRIARTYTLYPRRRTICTGHGVALCTTVTETQLLDALGYYTVLLRTATNSRYYIFCRSDVYKSNVRPLVQCKNHAGVHKF